MKQFHRLKHMLKILLTGIEWPHRAAPVSLPVHRYEKGFNRTLPKVKQHQRMMKKRRARKVAKRRMRK